MALENAKFSAQRRLTTWKEIATFVGRDERTVKRWEESRGLPVRRVPGAGHASVFAYADEIEAWLRGHPVPDETSGVAALKTNGAEHGLPGRRTRWFVLGSAFVFAGLILAAVLWRQEIWPFSASQGAPVARRHIPDPAAVELYHAGLHEWQTRTPSGLAQAIADFNQAIASDGGFAEAYAGLADAYDLEPEYTATPPSLAYPKAAAAAMRAIALDPSLAEAHAALAFADFYWSRDVPAAAREFKRALALDPKRAVTHHWYATFLMTIGDYDQALKEIETAESLDPESSAIPADKAMILFHAGQTEQAVRLLTKLEDDQPSFASPHRYLDVIWLATGNDVAYLRELKLASVARHDNAGAAQADAGAQGLAAGGHIGMLRAILARERALYASGTGSAYGLATICAMLNDARCAGAYLSESLARHETENIALRIDPPFAALRNDSRFVALMARAGLRGLHN